MHRLFIKLYITQLTLGNRGISKSWSDSSLLSFFLYVVQSDFILFLLINFAMVYAKLVLSKIVGCLTLINFYSIFLILPPLSPSLSFLFLPYFMLIYLFIKYSRWFVVIFSAKYLFVFAVFSDVCRITLILVRSEGLFLLDFLFYFFGFS